MKKILAAILFMVGQIMSNAQAIDVYIGTYTTNNGSKGIYRSTFDLQSGVLSEPELAAESPNPSFLVISPDKKYLYAVAELSQGMLRAFAIDSQTKKLRFINEVSSGGVHPCHLSMNNGGLFAANYSSGSVIGVYLKNEGGLSDLNSIIIHIGSSINPARQKSPHAHSVDVSSNGDIYVADLGNDKIMIYRWSAVSMKLYSRGVVDVTPGAGPRHMAFLGKNKFAYVINELDNTVIAFKYVSGRLTPIQTVSTLPAGFKGTSACAEIQIHPNGKFLYASNRGFDSLAVFRIAPATGTLSDPAWQTDGIKWPRHFILTPDGKWCLVANEKGDSIVVFRINQENGQLEATGNKIAISKPVCVQLMP